MIKLSLLRVGAPALATNALAVLAAGTLILTPYAPLGYLLVVATLVGNVIRHGRRGLGRCVSTHPLLVAGVLAAYAHERPDTGVELLVTGCLLLMLVVGEGMVAKAATAPVRIANLPPWRHRAGGGLTVVMFGLNVALIAALVVCAAADLPPAVALAVVSCGALAQGALALDALRVAADPDRLAWVGRELGRHEPAFLVHFSSPRGMTYQVIMWLSHLERVGQPFVVVVREEHHLAEVAAATRAPVVLATTIRALEQTIVPTVRAVVYVNNGMKNTHALRFNQLCHIQLLHGDSDKAASYNPVTAIFDRVYVAGQAGIDRYQAHGVDIPADRFRIVGRPQLAPIAVGPRRTTPPTTTVLYAPTWTGFYEDANHCSLPVAEQILASLLARGITVILRAHPYTARNRAAAAHLARAERLLARDRASSGRAHLWGDASARDLSLVDCINRADALIADVSSVVTDFLYSGRPFAITDMADDGPSFPAAFPMARIGYVIDPRLANLEHSLDLLLGTDPMAEQRLRARAYYLGDIPAESYDEAFVAAIRADLAETPPLAGAATLHSDRLMSG
jgi:hypothetical protein